MLFRLGGQRGMLLRVARGELHHRKSWIEVAFCKSVLFQTLAYISQDDLLVRPFSGMINPLL